LVKGTIGQLRKMHYLRVNMVHRFVSLLAKPKEL
jgi:hypothetical protein